MNAQAVISNGKTSSFISFYILFICSRKNSRQEGGDLLYRHIAGVDV